MSLEAWGDEIPDYGWSDDRVDEIARELFRTGAQMCREMMARFLEQGSDHTQAASVRANWNSNWGTDPGKPNDDDYDLAKNSFDPASFYP